ncbi:hypothetical protein [Jiangella asiatica]|uniref:Cytosine permease n=1 Tax=Jiangella asiatica TaxID=2530372 RepID=A0A4R5DPC3_9ACTN|nr:hypothetical protein [Jiangella asiatica]TDE14020.1 hypothetical protein E1269_04520 [Jiangella asiatica]
MTAGGPAPGPAGSAAERRWWNTAGAWLAIGTSPAALVLGAGVADRHDGPMPLVALLAGGVAMTVLLILQGRFGLRPPHGDGWALADVLDAYLPRSGRTLVALMMALAMAGWLGFNAGLGGAALASVVGTPRWLGVVVLGLPLMALALAGQHRWNALAMVTTAAALALVVMIAARGSPGDQPPVTAELGQAGPLLADVAVFVGYVSVFALRAPDFTAGLRGRSDLWACAGILVLPTLVAAAAGTTIALHSGSSDLVAHLRTSQVGTVLVVVAVVAPCLTAFHSGGLALRSVSGLSGRAAMVLVGSAGLVLAVGGFESALLPWLTVLAAVLPPLVVPLTWEAWARRRRHRAPRPVIWSMWLPAAGLGIVLTVADVPGAPLAGLAAAALCTGAAYALATLRARG